MRTSFYLLITLFLSGCAAPMAHNGVDSDSALAARCATASDGEACYQLGERFGEAAKQAAGCARGVEDACGRLPTAHRGVAASELDERATGYYRQACDVDHGDGCMKLGSHYAIRGDNTQAEIAFAKACKLGSKWGCRFLGSTSGAQ